MPDIAQTRLASWRCPKLDSLWSRGVQLSKKQATELNCEPASRAALRLNVIKQSRDLALLLLEAKELARFGSPEAVQAQPRPCRSPPARRGRRGPRGTAGPSTLPPRLARTASWRSTRWREPLAAACPRRHRGAARRPAGGSRAAPAAGAFGSTGEAEKREANSHAAGPRHEK